MAYSTNSTGELRSPDGCKIDKGSCFRSVTYHVKGDWLQLQFSDGSLYHILGPWTEPLLAQFDRDDPGCLWNQGALVLPQFRKLLKGPAPGPIDIGSIRLRWPRRGA